jgi:NADH-quinone oxidoreductase subunit L
MERWLFLIPLLPLIAFAVNILLGRSLIRENAHWVAAPAVFGSFVLALLVLSQLYATGEPISQHLFTWIPAGDFVVEVNLYADQLTAIMLGRCLLRRLPRPRLLRRLHARRRRATTASSSYLPLFVFSMLMLSWPTTSCSSSSSGRGVGVCSFLLIGFWFKRRSAGRRRQRRRSSSTASATSASVLGIMWIFAVFGTISFQEVFAASAKVAVGIVDRESRCCSFLAPAARAPSSRSTSGCRTRWRTDPRLRPDPRRDDGHRGIYLVARAQPIFELAPTRCSSSRHRRLHRLHGGDDRDGQNDIKRVVAYSTLSQLGYMAFALGVGAWVGAIFHLMTHAFFKALLFLGSGSVIHGMHEEQDIRRMGGPLQVHEVDGRTFVVASLANAGVVPFRRLLEQGRDHPSAWVSEYQPIGQIASVVGLVAAFFTGLYMFRLVFLVFFGPERFDRATSTRTSRRPRWRCRSSCWRCRRR